MKHPLDDAYNDGAVWFADVEHSHLTNGRLEFIIPLDPQENYEDDHISKEQKEIYDMYVRREEYLKPAIADALRQWSDANGYKINVKDSCDADTVISKFEVFHAHIEEDLDEDARALGIVFSTNEKPCRTVIVDIDLIKDSLSVWDE